MNDICMSTITFIFEIFIPVQEDSFLRYPNMVRQVEKKKKRISETLRTGFETDSTVSRENHGVAVYER